MSILGLGKFSARLKKVVKQSENEEVGSGSGTEVNNVMRFTAGTVITGLLTCPDNCYFDGKIEGGIIIGNKLVLGEHSEVHGQVTAGDLMAKGTIAGAVMVAGKTIAVQLRLLPAVSVPVSWWWSRGLCSIWIVCRWMPTG